MTGLKINQQKSASVPISIPQHLHQIIQQILCYRPASLPIKYLGLPLTLHKPNRMHFQSLVKNVQKTLASWKANLLSLGGRVALVKSVLIGLSLHYMQVMRLPKWVVKEIDQLRRAFLWKGNESCNGINCLVQNEELFMKLLWMLHTKLESPWG